MSPTVYFQLRLFLHCGNTQCFQILVIRFRGEVNDVVFTQVCYVKTSDSKRYMHLKTITNCLKNKCIFFKKKQIFSHKTLTYLPRLDGHDALLVVVRFFSHVLKTAERQTDDGQEPRQNIHKIRYISCHVVPITIKVVDKFFYLYWRQMITVTNILQANECEQFVCILYYWKVTEVNTTVC